MKIKINKEMKIVLLKATIAGVLDTDLIPELKNVVAESPEMVIRNYFGIEDDGCPLPFGIIRKLHGLEDEKEN